MRMLEYNEMMSILFFSQPSIASPTSAFLILTFFRETFDRMK